MSDYKGFSIESVIRANERMIRGEKPTCHVSDNLSDEDIDRAWRNASRKVFGDSAIINRHEENSDIYYRLVADDHDILGHVAYSLYKHCKREFVERKQKELGVSRIPDEIIEEFKASQTNYMLQIYRSRAQTLIQEFINTSPEYA